jgi:hypothetical protein
MLVRLLYASRSAKALNAKTVAAILAECQRNNPKRGITGVLCYSGDIFLQVLEGGRDAVCDTFNSIVGDERHHTVRLLSFEEVSERRFGCWTMGQVNMEKINSSMLLKYAEKAELNPFAVSGQVSMALLEELIATASVVGGGARAGPPPPPPPPPPLQAHHRAPDFTCCRKRAR